MSDQPQTFTDVIKLTARVAVSMYVTKATHDQLIEHTDINPDGIPVKLISGATGATASMTAGPYTDRAIDAVSSKITTWRANRKQKKETKDK